MNKITNVFALLALFFTSACHISKSAEAEKPETNTETVLSAISPLPTPELKTDIKSSQIESLPSVWVGGISFENGVLSSDGVWSGGDDTPPDIPESQGGLKIGTSYEVDVMNCGGFLGSAKVMFVKEGGFPPDWLLKFVPETIAADAAEKVRVCKENSETISSDAFAVMPRNTKRQSVKIGKVNTKKIFASLPKEIKENLNKYSKDLREKNNLSLKTDNWTDIDGDGNIDLLEVSGRCGDFKCGSILYLVKGKWIKIGHWTPA